MKNMKKTSLFLASLLCISLLAGCGAPKTPAPADNNTDSTAEAHRVGMILSGPITDVSWNGPQYKGLQQIEAKGAEIAYQENVSVSDVSDALYTYCDEGFDVVFLGTNYYEETVLPIMAEYPTINFFIINGTTTTDNVHSFQVADEQQGFMMGVVAALSSQTKNVGFVGGREITPIFNGKSGFEQGVAYVNNGTTANTTITGTIEDVTANKETSKSMISEGADVLAPMCDNSGLGVVEAAQEAGVYAVASAEGQSAVAPNAVLLSVIKDNGIAVVAAYDAYLNKTLSNEALKLGAAEGVITLSDWYAPADFVSAEIKAQVATIYADLAAGKIQIELS